jgi:hypothetical protein
MNGKPDQATQKVSFRIERLTRRLTLADPARLATKPVQYEYLCAAATLRRDRHTAPQGRSVAIAGGGAGGLRETKPLGSKTQAQAPFRPKGTFGLSVATFADSFLMRIRQRTPPDGRQGDQSASRLSHFRCFTSLAPAFVHLRIQGPRTTVGGFVAPRCHLSPFASFHPASEAIRFRSR